MNKGFILKTAAVASCVVVLGVTGCRGGVNEAAAVKNKGTVSIEIHEAKGEEINVISKGDREETVEAVDRSDGHEGRITQAEADDTERDKGESGREQEDKSEAEQPEAEVGDAGEEVGSVDDGDTSDESDTASAVYSEPDMGDGEYTDYTDEWYEPNPAGVEAEEGFTDEYSDSGVDESGYSDGAGYSDESGANDDSNEQYGDSEYSEDTSNGWSDGATDNGWSYYGTAFITHFCPCEICCGSYSSGFCASGALATEGRTVAAGYGIPFGTEVMINGNVYVVEDRGVDDGCFDIFVNDHNTALAMGAYYTDVYIKW